MRNFFLILGGLLLTLASAGAAADAPVAKGVRVATYSGWEESMFLSGGDCKAVIVPATGGRIAHYSLNGENILFENPASFGKTLVNTPDGFWVGGYQCDIGPEIRGLPDHPKIWMWPHRWRTPRENTVGVLSEPDLTVGLQLEKEIVMDPDTGELGIVQRMRNVIDKETAFCLWDRTLCKGDGFAFFPLNRSSRFPAGWSIRNSVDKKYSYNGKDPSDARVKVLDGVLVTQAGGPALKVGADSDAGWIAYARGKLLFVKYFPFFPKGDYTDGGNSVEFYCDARIAELEPLSPEIKLKPGENYSFPEKWVLIELKDEVTTHAQARALVKRVPASPFKK